MKKLILIAAMAALSQSASANPPIPWFLSHSAWINGTWYCTYANSGIEITVKSTGFCASWIKR